jgi:ribosomal protein L19E
VRKETGRWKRQRRIWDLFADRRCSQAVLEFLTSTDVGRVVPAVEVDADARSDVSEWELRERQEREEERRAEGKGKFTASRLARTVNEARTEHTLAMIYLGRSDASNK